MLKSILTTCVAIGVMSAALSGQGKPAPAAAPGKAPAAAVDVKRRNVSIEVAITDQTGAGEPVKKAVTMVVTDRQMGSVRSSGNVAVAIDGTQTFERRMVTLNVDATPVVHSDDSMLLTLTLEYVPRPEDGPGAAQRPSPAQLNERMAVTLESGKPMVISRAADPGSNRKMTVEVTATVMK